VETVCFAVLFWRNAVTNRPKNGLRLVDHAPTPNLKSFTNIFNYIHISYSIFYLQFVYAINQRPFNVNSHFLCSENIQVVHHLSYLFFKCNLNEFRVLFASSRTPISISANRLKCSDMETRVLFFNWGAEECSGWADSNWIDLRLGLRISGIPCNRAVTIPHKHCHSVECREKWVKTGGL